MRISLICILCTAGIAASQSPAERENGKLVLELQKYDISFDIFGTVREGKKMSAAQATMKVTKKSLDGLKLLRPAQVDFVQIQAEISDLSLMEAFLKHVADVPGPKQMYLSIRGGFPQDKDLARLAELKADVSLSFDFPDISAAQVKQLTTLKTAKNLKSLSFRHTDPMPEALAELKLALPKTESYISQDIPRHMRKLVKLEEKDEPMKKLVKSKLLAAIDCVEENYHGDSRGGSSSSSSSSSGSRGTTFTRLLQSYQMLRASLDELDDRELTLKLADDVVRLIEQVKQVHRGVSARTREKMPPELEYLSLDAQIWQMKLQKSAKPKAEK